jgi:hypothetical protein
MNIKAIKTKKTVEKLEKKIAEKAFRRYDELIDSQYMTKTIKNAAEYFNPRAQYEIQKPVSETVGQNINFIF